MLTYALIAASLLVSTDWKQWLPPSVGRCENKLKEISFMAKLSAVVKYRNGNLEAVVKFCKQWTPYI